METAEHTAPTRPNHFMVNISKSTTPMSSINVAMVIGLVFSFFMIIALWKHSITLKPSRSERIRVGRIENRESSRERPLSSHHQPGRGKGKPKKTFLRDSSDFCDGIDDEFKPSIFTL